jgi:ATP-dependent exoDNAse (exonuclease V) beta subunit
VSVTEEHHLAGPAPRIRAAAEEGALLAGPLDRSVLSAAAGDPARALLQETASHRADAGVAWGSLIHGLLEQAMRQDAAAGGLVEDAAREDLRRLAQWLTIDTPDLRPWIPQAIATVEAVMQADFWRAARRARACLVEVPFALGDHESVQHGVIDLVYETDAGWRVIDYKTDRVSTGTDLWRMYGPQIRAYADAWKALGDTERVSAGLFSVRLLELAMG